MKNKFTKENILTFSAILLLSFVFCFNFFNNHFTIDTYILLEDGFYIYPTYALLPIGRIVSTLMFYLFYFLNIDILAGIKLSTFLGIIICSITTFILYKSLLKYFNNNILTKLLILIISFFSIFNFSTIELFAYAESASMCSGLLLAVLASIIFTSKDIKHRYLYSQILVIFCAFCYQSTLSVFVILTILFFLLQKRDILKNLKKILLCFFQYGIATILDLITIKIIVNIFNIKLYKISLNISIKNIFNNFLYFSKCLLLKGINIIPKYSYIIVLLAFIILLIFIIKKRKLSLKYLLNVILFSIISYTFTLLPMLTMDPSELYFSPRMYIGAILLIIFLFVYILFITISHCTFNYKKFFDILCILFTLIFICNLAYFHISSKEMLISNEQDKKLANYILEKIENYEQTNQEIVYIIPIYDNEICFSYENTTFSCVTRGFASIWSVADILSYYSNRDFISSQNISTNIYNTYFKEKNWDNFSDEQLVFDEDTLYIGIY